MAYNYWYFATGPLHQLARVAGVGATASLLLSLPIGMPVKSSATMMQSVVSFVYTAQIARMAFTSDHTPAEGQSTVASFATWMGSYLWFMLPVTPIAPEVCCFCMHS